MDPRRAADDVGRAKTTPVVRRAHLATAVLAAVFAALALTGCAAGAPPQPATGSVTPSGAAGPSSEPSSTATRPDATPSAVRVVSATVGRIVDGDTIEVRVGGRTEKVRLIGVDTPENTTRVEEYGPEATRYTSRALLGRTVYLETDAELRDRYGRLLAHVWLAPPCAVTDREIREKLFNARLVLDGYANLMTIPPNVKYVDHLRRYETEAREGGDGLWGYAGTAGTRQGAPSGGSAAFPDHGRPAGTYVGNSNTMKFHLTSCSSASRISPSNRVSLASRETAVAKGFVPCKICDP